MSTPDVTSVTVRMYRGILGDSFLLRIRGGDFEQNVVIDCGVLQNVEDGAVLLEKLPDNVVASVGEEQLAAIVDGRSRIQAISNDVATTLRGDDGRVRVDVLVVTHEHYDHISGFSLAREIWEDPALEIGALWMAWTENERDEDAIALRTHLGSARNAVVRAAMAAEVLGAAGKSDELDALTSLADFLGPIEVDGMALGPSGEWQGMSNAMKRLRDNAAQLKDDREQGRRMTTAETMAMLKSKAGPDRTHYLSPGQVIEPGETLALRTYVLGPPRNVDRIKKDTPSSGARSEVYLTERDQIMAVEATAHRMLQRADAAFALASVSGEIAAASAHPFARPHERPYIYGQWDEKKDADKETPERRDVRQIYEANDDLRIDAEWLAGAEALALKLDSDTNNTSLVLAFELPDGSVLLFPGDAQVGNWMSWGDQKYPSDAEVAAQLGTAPPVQQSIDDILSRVCFYKVGHHGSHNATAKERGLELMSRDDMVAAIPLVEAVARIQGPGKKQPGRGWKMPYDHLHQRLVEKTKGRIVQGDGDPTAERQIFADQNGSPMIRHSEDGLWVELEFVLG